MLLKPVEDLTYPVKAAILKKASRATQTPAELPEDGPPQPEQPDQPPAAQPAAKAVKRKKSITVKAARPAVCKKERPLPAVTTKMVTRSQTRNS